MEKHQKNKEKSEEQAYKIHLVNRQFIKYLMRVAIDPKATSPEEILETLKDIPDLARADLLRAYSILTRDDRRFKSLIALPVDMRKDWLLMEIENK